MSTQPSPPPHPSVTRAPSPPDDARSLLSARASLSTTSVNDATTYACKPTVRTPQCLSAQRAVRAPPHASSSACVHASSSARRRRTDRALLVVEPPTSSASTPVTSINVRVSTPTSARPLSPSIAPTTRLHRRPVAANNASNAKHAPAPLSAPSPSRAAPHRVVHPL